jgi:Ni/Co efflux regulator RcnB
MTKLLSALVAAFFAFASLTPVAYAADKAEESTPKKSDKKADKKAADKKDEKKEDKK